MRLSGLVRVFAVMWVAVLWLVGNVWAQQLQVSFNLSGASGSVPARITNVSQGSKLGETQKPPTSSYTKTGYDNGDKWYTRTGTSEPYSYEEFIFGDNGTEVTENITLYLNWKPVSYNITYNLDDGANSGSNWSTYTILAETLYLQNPTKVGYTFTGWFDSETDGSQITTITSGSTGDITLWARWTRNNYTVSFDLNGGGTIFSEDFESSSHSFTLVNGSYTNAWAVGTATASDGSKSAYISNDGGTSYSYNSSYSSRVHMYRSVTFPVSSEAYTLKFNWKGNGTASYVYLNVYLVDETSSITAGYEPSGTLLGTFYGYTYWQQASISIPASNSGTTKRLVFTWYNYNYNYTPPIAVDNIVLTTPATTPDSISVPYDNTISTDKKPSTSDYTQAGYAIHDDDKGKWYTRTGTSPYTYTEFKFGDDGTKVTGNTTLYLKWTPTYTVSFNLNYTSSAAPTPITVLENSKLSASQVPSPREFTRSSYVNDGKWYTRTGTSPYTYTEFVFGDNSTPVTEDITLYLQWTWISTTYSVSFNLNGISDAVPSTIYVAPDNTIFSEDFEGSMNSFMLVNDLQTNQWMVGTDTYYSSGSKSAYISNDGNSNSYTNVTSKVHIYSDVTFPASAQPCTLSFYWKGIGEAYYHYLSVHLVETSVTPTAGTELESDTKLENAEYYESNDWKKATIIIPVINNGTTKRLVFTWLNDGGDIYSPPIAVDNIVLKEAGYGSGTVTATAPSTSGFTRAGYANDGKWYIRTGTAEPYDYTEFIFGDGGTKVTDNVTLFLKWMPTHTVSFDLNGGINTNIDTIFSEDFEGTNSFTIANSTGSQNRWYVGTNTYYAGTNSAYIATSTGTTNSYNSTTSTVHMYRNVTFPASSEPYTLSFYWKGTGYSNYDYLSVRLVETTVTPTAGTAVSSGTDLGTYSGNSSWQQATVTIPASNSGTTKRLVFTWRNNSGYSGTPIAVDNITLKGLIPPASIANVVSGTISEVQKPETEDFTRTGYFIHDDDKGKWYTRTGTAEPYEYTEFVFGEGGTEVTSNITLYLKWTPLYNVSFNLNSGTGTVPSTIYVMPPGNTLSEAQKPSTEGFTRTGYILHDDDKDKWYTRTGASSNYVYTEFIFGEDGTKVTSNITLYLKWTPIYTVSFNLNGNGTIFSENFEGTNSFTFVNGSLTNQWAVGTATASGSAGSKAAYISNDNGVSNTFSSVASTVHMYYDVTFPTSTTAYTLNFDWKGRGGSGNYLSVHLVDITFTPTAGTAIGSSTVLDDFFGGGNPSSTWQQATVSIPATNSGTTKRLVFTWRNGSSTSTQPPIAVDNIVLTTNTTSTVVGTPPSTITSVLHGSTLNEAQKPSTSGFTQTGYIHDGKWYTRTGTAEPYVYTEFVFGEGGTEVTSNIALYLKWTQIYTVSFNLNSGTGTAPTSITNILSGSTLSEEQKPSTENLTRAGYIHDGKWYTRTGSSSNYVYTEFIFGEDGTKVTSNVTLYLKWTSIYTITFNPNGGEITPTSGSTDTDGKLASLPTPTRTGYTFSGWYTAVTGGTQITTSTEFSANTTIYARWTCTYLDENGETQYVSSFTEINANSSPSNLNGWYLVRGNVTPSTLTVSGAAHIILADNSNLTVTGSSSNAGINVSEGNSLTIYAQSTGNNMGSLTANGGSNGGAGIGGGGSSGGVSNTIFTESFESIGWSSGSGNTPTNRWVRGGTTSHNGSYSAYITNGSAYSYNITSESIAHIYKDITFPVSNSDFTLTFWFKGVGESGFDYMTVRYSTTSSTPVQGSVFSNGTQIGTDYWNNSSWTQKTINLPSAIFSGRTMRLVFTWINDASAGTQPPAAIDDISITGTTTASYGTNVGEITINGGAVTANGGNSGGAGIGGGSSYSGSIVTINGGVVTATGGSGAQGIGRGSNGSSAGTFAMNGNAIVFASSVGDETASRRTGGILFDGNNGTFYGTRVTISGNITIPEHHTLSIPSGRRLTIPIGTTLTNNGSITPANNSTVIINGTLSGKINGANTASPTVIMRTVTSVMLGDDTRLLAATGQGVEYAISESDSALAIPSSSWQSRTVFTGLKPETIYYVFARSKMNDNFNAGAASAALRVETMSLTPVIAAPHCVGTACYTTPVSYYTLRGTPLGAQKPTTPGVYIEKQGYVSRKIIVR